MLEEMIKYDFVVDKVADLSPIGAKIMFADNDLTITYMNPAAVALMQEAETDLKNVLPNFCVSTLIGSNIAAFFKNPSPQLALVATLQKPHNATICVGSRAFYLLVRPLFENGKRIGFLLEWADAKYRPRNRDYFSADGTKNVSGQNSQY